MNFKNKLLICSLIIFFLIGYFQINALAQSSWDEKSPVSNEAYDATTWNNVKKRAPSKNAIRDKIESILLNFTFTKGSDVASANNMTLGDGNIFDITGTTTINTIASKGVGTVIILEFDGILQLTHSNDLFLPTAANITTAAGDIVSFYEYATGDWRCFSYMRADGTFLGSVKIDDLSSPDDNTDLNVSTSAHGLMPKAPNDNKQHLSGLTGTWANMRQFSSLPITTGETQTTLTEDQILNYATITNQGGGAAETDVKLPALTYEVVLCFEDQEGQGFEVCPPTDGYIRVDGAPAEAANVCAILTAGASYFFYMKNTQDTDGTWYWHASSHTGLLAAGAAD